MSFTEIAAMRVPFPVGVNLTLIWQSAATASADPQVLVCEKSPAFVPEIEMFEMASETAPELARVMLRAPLDVPLACCAKVTAWGAKLAVVAPFVVATVSVINRWWIIAEEVPTSDSG